MSILDRRSPWTSLAAAAWLVAGASAHAQVLRERDLGVDQSNVGWFGYACANAGDVDGDGTDDFIVGSPYCNGTGFLNGRVVVYSGATGGWIRSHDGQNLGEELGYSVAGVGDIDGDGVPDYVAGAPTAFSPSGAFVGKVAAYSGASGASIWTTVSTSQFEYFGIAVSGVGDVDGDGLSDVVVGTRNSEVFVLDHSGQTIRHVTNPSTGFGFGASVSGCGDLDGDGVKDFLVGAPLADLITWNDLGLVAAYSGATGNWLHTIWGSNVGDEFGWTLAALGDVNGDGFDDYIAGSPWSSANGTRSGIIRVVSAGGGTIREQTGDVAYELHGSSVCGMGDVDGDGVPDYAVGAIDAGSGGEGRVRICSGSSGNTIYERYGVAGSNQDLGASVASGDWNGDGVPDLVAGDFGYIDPTSGNFVGAVEIELMCPAWWVNYGAGWAGKNGIPTLTAQQDPEVGSPIDLDLSNSLGAATTALLFVGIQDASIPLKNSGTLLVTPLFTLVLPLAASGLTLSDALPDDPALYFLDVYLQAVEVDKFASKGLSFTPGLQLHCGFDLP